MLFLARDFTLIACLFLSSQLSSPQVPAKRTVQVVIIGVTDFKIAEYNNTVLKEAILDRCSSLGKYFKDHLGSENVTVRPYCTPQTTTREALRRLLLLDIPSYSANTVPLIFLMSHGEGVTFENDYVKSDLEIIASDTSTSDVANDAKGERLFSSVLLGDAITWLAFQPKDSVASAVGDLNSVEIGSLTRIYRRGTTPAIDTLADQFELVGDFSNAAYLYNKAAVSEHDLAIQTRLAGKEYFALAAAGDAKGAENVRQKYAIAIGPYATLESEALKDKSKNAQLTYKALSIIHALGVNGLTYSGRDDRDSLILHWLSPREAKK